MLTLDDISTGASNDIQRATDIAKEMVTKYGFSDKLGPVNYSSGEEVFLGKDFSTRQSYSEGTAAAIDEEVKAIIEEAYEAAKKILTENMEQLKNVAEGLLAVETLDHDQFVLLFNGERTPEELAEDLRIEMEAKKAKDAEEAKESAKLRKKEADLAKRRLAEAEKLAEATKGNNSRFKPMIMTYNEETKRAEPVELEKFMKEQQAIRDAAKDIEDEINDDDMPSEEELAVYDTDYLHDDEAEDADSDATEESSEEPEKDAEKGNE
jgi:cell division protease FtsH